MVLLLILNAAFFVHNQYRKACGLRGLAETESETELLAMADRHIAAACGVGGSPEGLLNLGNQSFRETGKDLL
jgi:hypothetical protein